MIRSSVVTELLPIIYAPSNKVDNVREPVIQGGGPETGDLGWRETGDAGVSSRWDICPLMSH